LHKLCIPNLFNNYIEDLPKMRYDIYNCLRGSIVPNSVSQGGNCLDGRCKIKKY